MKLRYYLKITPNVTLFVGMPSADLSHLYPLISPITACVERFKTPFLKGHPYVWVDENGVANCLPYNYPATVLAGGSVILGNALLDIGSYDLNDPKDVHRWEKKMAGWKGNGIITFPSEVPA